MPTPGPEVGNIIDVNATTTPEPLGEPSGGTTNDRSSDRENETEDTTTAEYPCLKKALHSVKLGEGSQIGNVQIGNTYNKGFMGKFNSPC